MSGTSWYTVTLLMAEEQSNCFALALVNYYSVLDCKNSFMFRATFSTLILTKDSLTLHTHIFSQLEFSYYLDLKESRLIWDNELIKYNPNNKVIGALVQFVINIWITLLCCSKTSLPGEVFLKREYTQQESKMETLTLTHLRKVVLLDTFSDLIKDC